MKIFIVGNSRSGTTMLGRILGNHPQIHTFGEFLCSEVIENRKLIPCEQTPRYLFCADQIMKSFPDSVIVNIIRDPRDILLSQKNKWRRRYLGAKSIHIKEAIRAWVNYHSYLVSKLWVSSIRKASAFVTDEQFVSIKFKDLLRNPDTVIKQLCDDIGISFKKGMLQVSQIGSSSGVDKPGLKGINSGRIQAWRKGGLSSSELAICERVAGKDMLRLGYEPSAILGSYFKMCCSMGVLILKSWLIFLLNFNRTKDLTNALKKRFFTEGV